MIYETEKYVDLLIKLGITPNQFFICWTLYNKQFGLLKRYIDMAGVFKAEDVDVLVAKDLILLTTDNPKLRYDVVNMVVTLQFAEEIVIDEDTAWEELFKAYPNHLLVNSTKYPAKGLTISDERACEQKYGELLKKNKFLHTRIITLIERWKQDNNGYATMKIDKFLVSKYWEELDKSENTGLKPRMY